MSNRATVEGHLVAINADRFADLEPSSWFDTRAVARTVRAT